VADDDPAPIRASILSYVDRELEVLPGRDGHEVRYGDVSLAWVENPLFAAEARCTTRGAEWTFTRLRGGDTHAAIGTAVIARYDSNLLPGGKIELGDGSLFRLRAPVGGEIWRVRRGRRELVLDIRPLSDRWAIRFAPAAREVHELPLLTMFAFHAVLVEIDRPTGGPTGGLYGG
jgi:hypothetical protein